MTHPTEKTRPLLEALGNYGEYARMASLLQGGKGPVGVFGLHLSHKAHVLAALAQDRTVLAVASSDAQALALQEAVVSFGVPAELFLPREMPLVHLVSVSRERQSRRISALARLCRGETGAVIASVSALMQRLCPRENFAAGLITLDLGDEIPPRKLMERLIAGGYERTELVSGPGQTAMRGDILDVFSPDQPLPFRIEFFGDEIDQIRTFDPESQRSVEQCRSLSLAPALETPQDQRIMERGLKAIAGKVGFAQQEESWSQGLACAGADVLLPVLFKNAATILDYLPKDALLFLDEPYRISEGAEHAALLHGEMVTAMLERGEGLPAQGDLCIPAGSVPGLLFTERTLTAYTLTRPHPAYNPRAIFHFDARPAAVYLGDTGELYRDLNHHVNHGDAILLYAGERADTLFDALSSLGAPVQKAANLTRLPEAGKIQILPESLRHGFYYPELHLAVFSESEIFGKNERGKIASRKKPKLKFSELAVGDYIVHEVHGIGRFIGVEALTVDGNTRDYLNIEYKGGDRLFIPTDQLDRIQKYIGGGDEDTLPPVSKLGGSDWQNRVNKVKASAKKLAFDLSRLYADRSARQGFAFPKDNDWQKQLEEHFPYRETPDQLRSINEIKGDMESTRPMDRLLCGDVGYGKTEVALRAAFKAVQGGKQVAFLAPTTILAEQHFGTAQKRFADFPINVACLSRFRSTKEKDAIKKKLKDGQIDLLVGTHALLAKDVVFKDLGLLIIDEEHRFGVNHKEQIKELKRTVDVLTLSATPIPRTLNMSMTGIRDISLIETPPEERFPVQTYVMEYSEALIVEAISKELARGGQAYVVYNRVASMESYAEKLSKLLPQARIITAHGQMPEAALEKAMLTFFNREADVLLCSTIIESGLDVPTANTLIVTDADRMGLAQLYQLRGRVGRSTRLGYAYFTIRRNLMLSEKAAKRLSAIREFTRFGAGFQIAMRDLEIRGAGSLLGAEQHGHIADIGYEYYCKLMNAAVREAKGERPEAPVDTVIDLPLDAHIPVGYIPNEVQRLYAYRRIADIVTDEDVMDMREELTDRYGDPPTPVENLFLSARVKALAKQACLASVSVKEGGAKLVYAENVQIDGGKLLTALSVQAGTKLLSTAPPAIQITLPRLAPAGIAKKLLSFLPSLIDCAQMEELSQF
ncbi:MAG: transcription-repair coupling factor [Clostridia bacterium]|nr:transcription-repair coupling factor [Clostridia bacterium]